MCIHVYVYAASHLPPALSLPILQLSLLQSCMSLLFLVTTRCPDITVELTQLSRRLTKDRFLLLTSLLYPLELHAPLLASRLLPSRPTPASREGPLPPPQALLPPLPNIDTLKITNPSAHQSSAKCPIIKLHRTQLTPGVPTLTSHQPQLAHTSHQAHPTHNTLTSHQPHPTHTTLASHQPHPTHTTITSHHPQLAHTLNTSIPLKAQNIKSLSLNKASVASKHQVVWHSPTKKRVKLSCENCDAGTTTCCRCQSLAK